jgi:glutamate synthase domain-containing protein 3
MTGGRVVVLGRTGRNFAAGMSGGIAYVLDSAGTFQQRCNMAMVELEPLEDPADVLFVQSIIESHVKYTGSDLGQRILNDFDALKAVFVKVMPRDFKRVLHAQARAAAAGREATFLELTGASVNG